MYALNELTDSKRNYGTDAYINGKWVPARPLVGSWLMRLRDAWRVLIGKADAFTWPEGQ